MKFKSSAQRKAVMAKLKGYYVNVQWRGTQPAEKYVRQDGTSKYPIERDCTGRVILRNDRGFVVKRFPPDVYG
jgi:hypothetical protein